MTVQHTVHALWINLCVFKVVSSFWNILYNLNRRLKSLWITLQTGKFGILHFEHRADGASPLLSSLTDILVHNIYNLRWLPWQQLLEGRYLGVGKSMPVWSEVEENACGCPWKTDAPHEQNDQHNVRKQGREVYNLKHTLRAGPATKFIRNVRAIVTMWSAFRIAGSLDFVHRPEF
jgi:hypothetical protein